MRHVKQLFMNTQQHGVFASSNSVNYILSREVQGSLSYYAFDIFHKVFLLDALHRRSKFANFCHDLMQNHLS